jgi:hypothetical protein
MQQHEELSQENNVIKTELERLSLLEHKDTKGEEPKGKESTDRENNKVVEMQKNFNTLHLEHQKLE